MPAEESVFDEPPPDITPGQAGPAWRILFKLASPLGQTVGLDIWRVTVLGRADPMSAFRPDLDYGPFGAMRHGVSRRHALIRPGDNALYLIDQNSTNGTWVNGQRLVAGRPYMLADGDAIELGALAMKLMIVQSPVEGLGQQQEKPRRMRGKRFRFFG
nr:FHA domain-containing protein [Anaerolineae bacterium]